MSDIDKVRVQRLTTVPVTGRPCQPLLLILLTALHLSVGCNSENSSPIYSHDYQEETEYPMASPLDDFYPPTPMTPVVNMRKMLGANSHSHFDRSGVDYVTAILAESGATTLEPLRGQPLRQLDIAKTTIFDLSPVTGMPLESLACPGCPIVSLAPIQGAGIQILDLSDTKVTDFSTLSTLSQLRELYLEKTAFSDLTLIQKLPLEKLWLTECPITQLTPLEGKSIVELNLCRTQIESLQSLAKCSLETLWLCGTETKDLSPLKSLNLVSLDLEETPVTDLSPLREMKSLKRLNLKGSDVVDLTPLADLELVRLIFSPEKITSGIEQVRGMKSLQQIDISFDGMAPVMTASEFWELYDAGKFKPESTEKQ